MSLEARYLIAPLSLDPNKRFRREVPDAAENRFPKALNERTGMTVRHRT